MIMFFANFYNIIINMIKKNVKLIPKVGVNRECSQMPMLDLNILNVRNFCYDFKNRFSNKLLLGTNFIFIDETLFIKLLIVYFLFILLFFFISLFFIQLYQYFNNNIFFVKEKQIVIKNVNQLNSVQINTNSPNPNNDDNLLKKILNNLKEKTKNLLEFSIENSNVILIYIGAVFVIIIVGSISYKLYIYNSTSMNEVSKAVRLYIKMNNNYEKITSFFNFNNNLLHKKSVLINYPDLTLSRQIKLDDYFQKLKNSRLAHNKIIFKTLNKFNNFDSFYNQTNNYNFISQEFLEFKKYLNINCNLPEQHVYKISEINFNRIIKRQKADSIFDNFNNLNSYYKRTYKDDHSMRLILMDCLLKNNLLTFTKYCLIQKKLSCDQFSKINEVYFINDILNFKKNQELNFIKDYFKRLVEDLKKESVSNFEEHIAVQIETAKKENKKQKVIKLQNMVKEYNSNILLMEHKSLIKLNLYVKTSKDLIDTIEKQTDDIVNMLESKQNLNKNADIVFVEILKLLKGLDLETTMLLRKENPSLNYFYSSKDNRLLQKTVFLDNFQSKYDEFLIEKITDVECNVLKLTKLFLLIQYELNYDLYTQIDIMTEELIKKYRD